MPTSQARIEANRRNAARSTGPRSTEGKEQSRRNSYKHGMTGRGVVVPDEDAGALAGRFEGFDAELKPRGEVGRFLVRQAAMMSIRIERCQRQEAKAISERVRNAEVAYVDRRMAEVERLFEGLAEGPATNARRLRQTPEGVDKLLGELRALMEDMVHPTRHRWGRGHVRRLDNLMGRRAEDSPTSPAGRYLRVAGGDPSYLDEGEAEGLSGDDLACWALSQTVDLMDAEAAALEALRASFDGEAARLDREEAKDRALFDASKDAALARKYEAAATREFHRALADLRQIEPASDEAGPEPEEAGPEPEEAEAALGSSFPAEPDPDADEDPGDPEGFEAGGWAASGWDGVRPGVVEGAGPGPEVDPVMLR